MSSSRRSGGGGGAPPPSPIPSAVTAAAAAQPRRHAAGAVPPEIVPLSMDGIDVPVQLGRRRLNFREAIQLANDIAALLGGSEVARALLQASGSGPIVGSVVVADLLPVLLDRIAAADWLLWLDYLFDGQRPVEPGSDAARTRGVTLPVLYYAPIGVQGPNGSTHWAPVVEELRDQIFPRPFEALSVALRLLQEGLGPFGESAPSLGRDG